MTEHTIRYSRKVIYTPDNDGDNIGHLALAELARDFWSDSSQLWSVELDGCAYPFNPPPAEVRDADVARCANALVDRSPGLDLFAARDHALTVLYAFVGRCSDCGRVLDAHDGPTCAADRAMAGLM